MLTKSLWPDPNVPGRSTVQGPWSKNADLAALKNFYFTERFRLQFRSEFFNALNHPNWNMPARDLAGGNFGVVTGASSPRIIQFGLKMLW